MSHLPLQLHWSLEYCERAILHRTTTDSKYAKNGESMFIPALFLLQRDTIELCLASMKFNSPESVFALHRVFFSIVSPVIYSRNATKAESPRSALTPCRAQ